MVDLGMAAKVRPGLIAPGTTGAVGCGDDPHAHASQMHAPESALRMLTRYSKRGTRTISDTRFAITNAA